MLSHPITSRKHPTAIFVSAQFTIRTFILLSLSYLSSPLTDVLGQKLQDGNSLYLRTIRLSRVDACAVGKIHKCMCSPFQTFLPKSALTEPTQLEEYIRTTNPAPNGSKDLSKVREGDIICLEGSPCKIESVISTGKATLVEAICLFDDVPCVSQFNHCCGVTVSTFSGRPELLQCLVVS